LADAIQHREAASLALIAAQRAVARTLDAFRRKRRRPPPVVAPAEENRACLVAEAPHPRKRLPFERGERGQGLRWPTRKTRSLLATLPTLPTPS
jgi:hypothetical protein